MNISINNQIQDVGSVANLKELVSHLKIDDRGLAIAVDHKVVAKADWAEFKLSENNSITIIRATQGG